MAKFQIAIISRFTDIIFRSISPNHARAVAAARGLPLISIGYRNAWADEQWLEVGPHQFAALMRNAAGVATNFFHGCVFALLNAKPLACEVTDYRSVKISDLLAKLGAQSHLTRCANDEFDVR